MMQYIGLPFFLKHVVVVLGEVNIRHILAQKRTNQNFLQENPARLGIRGELNTGLFTGFGYNSDKQWVGTGYPKGLAKRKPQGYFRI